MGRLVIAHHKSYHPYKADNIERVRRDEELARLEEEKAEGKLKIADAEARIDLLRRRAGLKSDKQERNEEAEEDIPAAVKESVQSEKDVTRQERVKPQPELMKGGHINLFADLEDHEQSLQKTIHQTSRRNTKGKGTEDEGDTDKGFRLAPSQADRTPWYTKDKGASSVVVDEAKQTRDALIKSRHDPLNEIKSSLRKTSHPSPSSYDHKQRPPVPSFTDSDPARAERLNREASERARAAELRERKRRERERGSETPSTVSGGNYRNLYNKEDVEDARRRRDNVRGWRKDIPDQSSWDGGRNIGRRW